jgi:4-amino-4-deoxy-L-arabinose transferase-like glycosyltransferase
VNAPKWLLPERLPALLAILLLAVAILRIATTYHTLSQAYDEPADVVAGMEWLDKGTYTLNLEHPPLSTVAAAVGPFLAGLRLQEVPVVKGEQGPFYDLTTGGNNILYSGGNYWHNLTLARLGILPLFALGVLVVFVWTRELDTGLTALMAVLLFTTLPPILAFSGLAYTDLPVAVLIGSSAFVFAQWLERPRLRTSVGLGVTTALAVLANFPALLFVPTCWAAAMGCWWWFGDKAQRNWKRLLHQAVWVTVAFALVLWAGYHFSVQRLGRFYANPNQAVESLHVPRPVKHVLHSIVAINPPIPAPAFVKGFTVASLDSEKGRPSYLLGHIRWGGWWYFYLVALAVKTPLPFLLLVMLGAVAMLAAAWRKRRWTLLVPCFCVAAILLVTMPLKVNMGVRHILCIYVFLAILAGYGAVQLWSTEGTWRWPARIALIGILSWQVVSTSRFHPDYLAYFNELAGRHPEEFLLWGCDYDCGQDTGELARLLEQYNVSHLALRIFSSADLPRLGFPPFQILNPYEQTPGWVAVSVSTIRTGEVRGTWSSTGTVRQIPPSLRVDAYRWLSNCQPVARAGKTIFLYHVPCDQPAGSRPFSH